MPQLKVIKTFWYRKMLYRRWNNDLSRFFIHRLVRNNTHSTRHSWYHLYQTLHFASNHKTCVSCLKTFPHAASCSNSTHFPYSFEKERVFLASSLFWWKFNERMTVLFLPTVVFCFNLGNLTQNREKQRQPCWWYVSRTKTSDFR